MPLPDNLIVYPAHGAGSACGKNMMKETYDTLGNQKRVNYALREDMSKSEFTEEVLNGLESPPEYFPMNVKMNQTGYEDLSDIFKKSLVEINPIEFDELSKKNNHLVLDVRNENDYVRGHIPKSIFIGLNGSFAPWVGTLIKNVEKPILLVAPLGKEKEAITRLSRVGFDNVIGYLKGGFENWRLSQKRTDKIISLNAKDLNKDNNDVFYDVRNISELQSGKLKNSFNSPLDFIQNKIEDFPKNEPFYVHCAGGYRSVIAISLLKSNGIHNAIDIKGGFAALKKSEFQII
jgi:rhodanese-related sulfurtransferase